MMAPPTAQPKPTELELVEEWRHDCLVRAGFPFEVAEKIAHEVDIDLHRAIAMLQDGCPPDLVWHILSPDR